MHKCSKLGIIAGAGPLPVLLANASASQNQACHIIRLGGVSEIEFAQFPSTECGIAEVGKIIRELKEASCDGVVLAGLVSRPDFKHLKPDWRGVTLLPKIVAAAAEGDGALLNVLVETLEAEGFKVIGADEVTSNLVAPNGTIGNHSPSDKHIRDFKKAVAVIDALGPYDVGQAVVIASGLVLAIEAAEGTDLMLKRCATLKNGVSLGGILLKKPKPGQELRVDLPTIGLETLRGVSEAGLDGIAIEAGRALILDRDELIAEANKQGKFIFGFSKSDLGVQ